MKIAHLSQPQPNMSLIGEGCDSLGKTSLTSIVGNHWATGGLQVNTSSVKGGFISFALFLQEENAILPMTDKAGCGLPQLDGSAKPIQFEMVLPTKQACCAGCRRRPFTAEAPPIGNTHPFRKIAITFKPVGQFRCPSGIRIS